MKELPAKLGERQLFCIRRRRSLRSNSDNSSRHKKPTTANRSRLEAAIPEAFRFMPNVYKDSDIKPEELNKFPVVGEKEMHEHCDYVDLTGEVRIDRKMFCTWLLASREASDPWPCAEAVWRDAIDVLEVDLRGAVTAESVWDLCCRHPPFLEDAESFGSRDLASLIVYWLDSTLPGEMSASMYVGALPELHQRGKTVQTDDDSMNMKLRWVKQLLHRELDSAREEFHDCSEEVAVDLQVSFDMCEMQQQSITEETERQALWLKESLHPEQGAQESWGRESGSDFGSWTAPGGQEPEWWDARADEDAPDYDAYSGEQSSDTRGFGSRIRSTNLGLAVASRGAGGEGCEDSKQAPRSQGER